MTAELLDYRAWDAASSAERDRAARRLARALPTGFVYTGLLACRMGGVAREVARFEREGRAFALIPGGEVELGFDAGGWAPTSDEAADWDDLVEDYGMPGTLAEYVTENTGRVRTATMPSLLAEIVATPPKEERPLADVLGEWGREGFRVPMSDEWEWLCGAGSRTLYRWGDHAPSRSSPWTLRQAAIESPLAEPPIHLRPNAFGLRIAEDTYRNELVDRGGATRAGDGGGSECGGAAAVASWLVLATAARPQPREPGAPNDPEYEIVRRVLPLD